MLSRSFEEAHRLYRLVDITSSGDKARLAGGGGAGGFLSSGEAARGEGGGKSSVGNSISSRIPCGSGEAFKDKHVGGEERRRGSRQYMYVSGKAKRGRSGGFTVKTTEDFWTILSCNVFSLSSPCGAGTVPIRSHGHPDHSCRPGGRFARIKGRRAAYVSDVGPHRTTPFPKRRPDCASPSRILPSSASSRVGGERGRQCHPNDSLKVNASGTAGRCDWTAPASREDLPRALCQSVTEVSQELKQYLGDATVEVDLRRVDAAATAGCPGYLSTDY
ncbi:hypothetical protein CSUI_004049 [Cystoisospora suis]|uniref:Uncharacterized protein n=1 Tax=Cystoisospora suis TaxID=483139 RepID=A0A2C6KYM0_9APIC|nr:hypothetical protein CSUI_004049 [Cystoisospora suis]